MVNRKALKLPRLVSAALAVPVLTGAALITAPSAFAAETVTGPDGQELTVSETSLDPEGATVTVTGDGYREDVGVYVALCVVPEEGQTPGPCLGGVNMSGEEESSIWMSSNPPAYAEGLTVPFDDGGSFEVSLTVSANDGHTDCLDESVAPNGCAISTRADHTRDSDRSADVLIPVTFEGAAEGSAADEGDEPADEPTDEPANDDAEPTETPTEEVTPDEAGTESGEASDGVQNDDEKESAGNSTAIAILIAIVVLGAIVGASAVAFANRKKRQAARAAALENDASSENGGDK